MVKLFKKSLSYDLMFSNWEFNLRIENSYLFFFGWKKLYGIYIGLYAFSSCSGLINMIKQSIFKLSINFTVQLISISNHNVRFCLLQKRWQLQIFVLSPFCLFHNGSGFQIRIRAFSGLHIQWLLFTFAKICATTLCHPVQLGLLTFYTWVKVNIE